MIDDLVKVLQDAKGKGNPYERDVAIHAAMLVQSGWPVMGALVESARTLDEAEMEGAL